MAIEVRIPTILRTHTGGNKTVEGSGDTLAALDELRATSRVVRDALMREYAGAVPEALSDLPPEERHRVYRMMRLEVALAPNGDIEMRGDVAPVSKNGTAYRPG